MNKNESKRASKIKRRVTPRPGNGKCGLLNTRQVAQALAEHERTIVNLRRRKVIPYVVLGPRCYRYFLDDVIAALQKRVIKPRAAA
jgi:hypothetical protein